MDPLPVYESIKDSHLAHPESRWLLQNPQGKRWTDPQIKKILDVLIEELVRLHPEWTSTFYEVKKGKRIRLFTLHSFRATLIVLMLAWGWEVNQIQLVTRHRSDAGTKHYIQKAKKMSFGVQERTSELHDAAIAKLLDDLTFDMYRWNNIEN